MSAKPKDVGPRSSAASRRAPHDALVRKIVLALNATNLGRFWEQPTGAAYRDNELIRYGVIGSADISGVVIGGLRFECEVKTGRAVQSERQVNFMRMIRAYGGIYCVARSVEDALTEVEKCRKS